MTRDDLRRKNSSLHDRIEQALEMHPELRGVTEAMALSQDLHVEVGASFLERTQSKLQARARAIVNSCPELEHYFDDPPLSDGARRKDSSEAQLIDALEANVTLRIEAERLIAAYVATEFDRAAIINELIALFDGPQQREAQKLAVEALDRASERDGWHFL